MPSISQARYQELLQAETDLAQAREDAERTRQTVQSLTEQVERLQARPVGPQGQPVPFTGLVMICDPHAIEIAWHKKFDGKGQYMMTVTGDKAEFIANRPSAKIGPAARYGSAADCWRVILPHQMSATQAQDEAERYVRQEGLHTSISVQCAASSLLHAQDAAKRGGFGQFQLGSYPAWAVEGRQLLVQ